MNDANLKIALNGLQGFKDRLRGRYSLYFVLLLAECPNARDYLDGWRIAEKKMGGGI